MLELEENTRLLKNLEEKLKELGESLWHCKTRTRIKRIRKRDYARKYLAR